MFHESEKHKNIKPKHTQLTHTHTHTHARIKDIRRSGPDARLPFYNTTLGRKNTLVHRKKVVHIE